MAAGVAAGCVVVTRDHPLLRAVTACRPAGAQSRPCVAVCAAAHAHTILSVVLTDGGNVQRDLYFLPEHETTRFQRGVIRDSEIAAVDRRLGGEASPLLAVRIPDLPAFL